MYLWVDISKIKPPYLGQILYRPRLLLSPYPPTNHGTRAEISFCREHAQNLHTFMFLSPWFLSQYQSLTGSTSVSFHSYIMGTEKKKGLRVYRNPFNDLVAGARFELATFGL
jgi:hypothetical protein